MEFGVDWGLTGLFLSAFISATLAPGGSEVVLAYLLAQAQIPVGELFLAATAGNALGGASTYLLGVVAAKGFGAERVFGPHHARAHQWLRRFGAWALLLSWVPVVGDPLCLVAGWLRLAPIPALLAILIGKAARYAVVIGLCA